MTRFDTQQRRCKSVLLFTPARENFCPSGAFSWNLLANFGVYYIEKEVPPMDDAGIIDLYWARDEQALTET